MMIISPNSWGAERSRMHQEWADQFAVDPMALMASDYDGLAQQITFGKTAGDYAAAVIGLDVDSRSFFAIMTYVQTVEEGGHAAFFNGVEGVVWKEALQALRDIGAGKHVSILMGASLRAGGDPSMDLDQRRRQIANLVPKFDDLDRQFSKGSPLNAVWRHYYAARFGQVAA